MQAAPGPYLLKKLPKFADHFARCKRVLELGSGSGEFLGLLKERGIRAEGVEMDAERAALCRRAGHTVHRAEAVAFLKRSPRGRYDGLFLSNLIEHLELAQARALLGAAAARLAPGAKLALCTADPRCLDAMSHFWEDRQHVRPYPLPVLEQLLDEAGFRVTRAAADEDTRPQGPLRWLLRVVRTLLVGPYFGPSEIYVLAEKP